MSALPTTFTAAVIQLRTRCMEPRRIVGDLQRAAVLWLVTRGPGEPSSFSFVSTPTINEGRLEEPVYLACIGFLCDAGVLEPPARTREALTRVLRKSARTLEHSGYADDALRLAGLFRLACHIDPSAVSTLLSAYEDTAAHPEAAVFLALATEGRAATGQQTPPTAAAQLALALLIHAADTALASKLYPGLDAEEASRRFVSEVSLDRVERRSDLCAMVTLAAAESIVQRNTRVSAPSSMKKPPRSPRLTSNQELQIPGASKALAGSSMRGVARAPSTILPSTSHTRFTRLRERRDELANAPEPHEWEDVAVWIARTRPLIGSEFSEHLAGFLEVVKEPSWVRSIHVVRTNRRGQRVDNADAVDAEDRAANAQITRGVRERILAFLDGLLDLEVTEPSTAMTRANSMSNSVEELARRATIGILTALPKECAAVRFMLEQEQVRAIPKEEEHQYYLGKIPAEGGGEHVVALACLPDIGNNIAAVTATHFLHHFPQIDHIIMCGIAGGVPRPGSPEHDVRLGDIVVSNRHGVVQYDLIKEESNEYKEHRNPPRPPSARLLRAVTHLRTEEEMGRRPWEQFLSRGDPSAKWTRPDDTLDSSGNPQSSPIDTERTPGLPRVFHAPIAAANILLKNRVHRDAISNKFGVRAVEMEGSGVADATWSHNAGYLVVRGICDYCDETKGNFWQRAAALAAAAYVRALIGSMVIAEPEQER